MCGRTGKNLRSVFPINYQLCFENGCYICRCMEYYVFMTMCTCLKWLYGHACMHFQTNVATGSSLNWQHFYLA